jgi:amidase
MPGDPDRPPALPPGETFLTACERDPGRLRIGRYLDAPMRAELDPEVHTAWEQTSRLLAGLGHHVVDTGAPLPAEAVPAFETVWTVSAATVPVPSGREDELRPLTRHLRGRGFAATGAQFADALGALHLHARRGVAGSAEFDAVLTPTVAMLPRPVGWFTADGNPAADFERQKRYTPYTAMYNTTGQPAISLPVAATASGLPIGMMLVGRPREEALLLALAAQVEAARPWRERTPEIWSR